jgi:mannosyltransferase OCH1-like enzyme
MKVNFKVLDEAFFPTPSHLIKNHKVIVKSGKTYKVIDAGSKEAKSNKVSLGTILGSLSKEVTKSERTDEELKKALHISKYFYTKANKTAKDDKFKKIKDIFNRFLNLFSGNGFKTNSEFVEQIQKYLVSKNVKAEFPTEIEGFKPVDFWESMCKHRADPLDPKLRLDPALKTAEENFKNFCDKLTNSPKVDLTKPPENSSIPPTVHFVWIGSAVPDKINGLIDTWRKVHPGWEIKIWSNSDIEKFPWKNRSAFDEAIAAKSWAEAVDIWRLEILYNEGGIYSDVDVVSFRSFNELIASGATFFAGQETNKLYTKKSQPLYLCNALMGAAKGSSVIKDCIDNITPRSRSKFPSNPRKDILTRTGPILLSNACREALKGPEKDKILVLPCSYIYPLPWYMGVKEDYKKEKLTQEVIRNNYIDPETLTVHLWDGAW